MKLSVAWIFDHINADWRTCDTNELVAKFNQMTAEIEHSHSVSINLDNFFLGQQKNAWQRYHLYSRTFKRSVYFKAQQYL